MTETTIYILITGGIPESALGHVLRLASLLLIHALFSLHFLQAFFAAWRLVHPLQQLLTKTMSLSGFLVGALMLFGILLFPTTSDEPILLYTLFGAIHLLFLTTLVISGLWFVTQRRMFGNGVYVFLAAVVGTIFSMTMLIGEFTFFYELVLILPVLATTSMLMFTERIEATGVARYD